MYELFTVPFHGQMLTAALINNEPHVAMKPICENIGIDWEGQRQKILRHPVLKSTACMIKAVAEDGKLRQMLMLPINKLNGWLFLIDANRVRPEAKEKVIEYQEECFDVLAKHFMGPDKTPFTEYKALPYTDDRDYDTAMQCIENLQYWSGKHGFNSIHDEVTKIRRCLVSAWTEMDESLLRLDIVRHSLKRWRNK